MARCGLSEYIRFSSREIGLVQMFGKTKNLLSIQISLSLATITGYKRVMTKNTDNNNKIKQRNHRKSHFVWNRKYTSGWWCMQQKQTFRQIQQKRRKTHRWNETIENFIIVDSHEYDRLLLACLLEWYKDCDILKSAKKSHIYSKHIEDDDVR